MTLWLSQAFYYNKEGFAKNPFVSSGGFSSLCVNIEIIHLLIIRIGSQYPKQTHFCQFKYFTDSFTDSTPCSFFFSDSFWEEMGVVRNCLKNNLASKTSQEVKGLAPKSRNQFLLRRRRELIPKAFLGHTCVLYPCMLSHNDTLTNNK